MEDTETKRVTTRIVLQQWANIDIKEIAELSARVREQEGLGNYTVQQMKEHLNTMNERFPIEVVILAFHNEQLVGWIGIERVTKSIGNVGRWQPFVDLRTNRERVARLLISNAIDYATSNDMTRAEVGFGGISEENLATLETRRLWYEAEGWKKVEDTNFMVNNLLEDVSKKTPSNAEYKIRPMTEYENDEIFECYHETFTTSDARWIYDMTKEQRRQEFDKTFDRSRNINQEASFVIESGRKIVAFILIVTRSNEEEHLEFIGVHPNYRRRGLAKNLLARSIKVLLSQNAQTLTLGVDPMNVPAVQIYEQFGFKVISRIVRFSWKESDT
ncbi:MAG: GNAT family N-acetyltransferase [Candidatus Thorarchaeota archaeon]